MAIARLWCEESLGGCVGTDHQRDIAHAGEDLRRAIDSAVVPDAHAAYDDATWHPVKPSAFANVDPDT